MQLFDVYPLYPITPVRALGAKLWDEKGELYYDLYGGHAVVSIGHTHPHYVARLQEQLAQIAFYSNSVRIPIQEQLAQKLGEMSGYEDYNLFLCNSGAEANENALKVASFATGRKKVLAFKGSFHGRTSGAVALTDNPKIVAPFNADHHVAFVGYDLAQVEQHLAQNDVAAIIFEPIQGVGGIVMPSDDFWRDMAILARKYGTMLIADEVQSGYGRSGKFFAHQYADIRPDLISIAKGMGNGFPIGGLLVAPQIKAHHGMLGTTFGGNHLACAAAMAVLEVIEQENLIQNAQFMGAKTIDTLRQNPKVKEVRGRGLMIGVVFDQPIKVLRDQLLTQHHIFIGTASDPNVLRLLPPLNIQAAELQVFIDAIL
jgi:acetylornithine/N-succinyldiaminopimelate aminotransferase